MSDFGTMKSRIADEIARSDLTAQIEREILSAIDFYASRGFKFNQGLLELPLTPGQYVYTGADDPVIPNIRDFGRDGWIGADGWGQRLSKIRYEDLGTSLETSSTAAPDLFAYHNLKLYFFPIPGIGYTAKITYIRNLDALVDDTDTNAWMVDGESLIRSRAKSTLYENVIRQYEHADRMRLREIEALADLAKEATNLTANVVARFDGIGGIHGGVYNVYGDTH